MALAWDPHPLLTLDVVPQTCHFSNLRTELPKATWDVLRRAAYKVAGDRCVICAGRGPKHPVEAHEWWEYDMDGPEGPVQRLLEIQALCPACHEVKHFGLAQVKGNEERALRHLMIVNAWTRSRAREHVEEEQTKYQERSQVLWDLNVSVIDDDKSTLECFTKRRAKNKELRKKIPRHRSKPDEIDEVSEILARIAVVGMSGSPVAVGDLVHCPACKGHNIVAALIPEGVALACQDCPGPQPDSSSEVDHPEAIEADTSDSPDWTVVETKRLEEDLGVEDLLPEDEGADEGAADPQDPEEVDDLLGEDEDELAAPQVEEDSDSLAGFRWVE